MERESSTEGRREWPPVGAERIPTLVSGLGVALLLVVGFEWVVFAGLDPGEILDPTNVAGLVTSLPFAAGLVYGGYWLRRSSLPADRYPRIGAWTGGALCLFALMNVLSMSATEGLTTWLVVGWLRWAAAIGGGVGLLVGITEARAIERVREATVATARAEQLESQRQWLDYLNNMLRHEVLNTATVIQGNASLVLDSEDLDDAERERLETIRRQCEDMTDVIEDVRALIQVSDGHVPLRRTDLTAVLEEELRSLRDRHPHVSVSTSLPPELPVEADDLLPRLFTNLFANAVEHNDDDPRIEVTAERTDDTAVVRVSDNGPGVPDEEVDTLFEREHDDRSPDHGMGLYLVRQLAVRYDGRVELTDNGDDGATFTVELPLASGADDGRSTAGEPDGTVRSSGVS